MDPGYLQVGSMVAGYRLEERIGQGGMAVVYRAYDSKLGRQVALKVLVPELASDAAFRQRFIRESRAAAAVDSAHIIPVFEAGESAGVLFIAMRYVRGGDVRSLIGPQGMPPDQVIDIVSQAAAALDAAHARGLVHRDVKPANMLLEAAGADGRPDHVYLSDFGLTQAATGESRLTATGQFVGTVEYVAPEQIEGRPLDGRCDLYSLACSAFEMLCGRPPFRHQQSMSVLYAHISEPPPAIAGYRAGLPPATDAVLARALAKAPADRYASCRDFAAALRGALVAPPAPRPATRPTPGPGDTMTASRPATRLPPPREASTPGVASPPARPGGRRPAVLAALAVLVAALLAGGGFALAGRLDASAGNNAGAGSASQPAAAPGLAALVPPGCSTATATAAMLGGVRTSAVPLASGPFGVAVTAVGTTQYAFVAGGNAITVLRAIGTSPEVIRTIAVAGANKGDALTHDGRYVLAASGSGLAVVSVAAAIDGAADPVVGTLSSPHGSGAAEVVTTADDRFAFVTVQDDAEMAVFDLHRALVRGFGDPDFLGDVPLGPDPVGLAIAGGWLYVASEHGALNVVSVARAETDAPHAVTATVQAGCGPARAAVSADGKVLWVTASGSNMLLGFSTAGLHADPDHALIARVRIGEEPLGLALLPGSGKIVVADSDQNSVAGQTSSLAVVDSTRALARQPALLGYVPSSGLPRELAVVPDGTTLLVAQTKGRQLQTVRLADLPARAPS